MATANTLALARLAAALYGYQLGSTTMASLEAAVTNPPFGSVAAFADALLAIDRRSPTTLASELLTHLGLSAAQVATLAPVLAQALDATAAAGKGALLLDLIERFSATSHPDYQAAATDFNRRVALAVEYAGGTATADVPLPGKDPVIDPPIEKPPGTDPGTGPGGPTDPPPGTGGTSQTVLDFSGLSDQVAGYTGSSANRDGASGPLDPAQAKGDDRDEGLLVRLTFTDRGIFWAADRDGDDDTRDSDEIGTQAVGFFGIDSVIGGRASDTVIADKSMASSANLFKLGGQIDDLTPGKGPAPVEGADNVTFTHASIADPTQRPVITLSIETAAGVDKLTSTGGALGKSVIVDTLVDVEEIGVADAATSSALQRNPTAADTLDLSAIAGGAVVNFSGSAVAVGKALGGRVLPATTVAAVEGNTLEPGGVSAAGGNFGNELAEIIGIAQFERIVGSAGNDRVIVGNQALEAANPNSDAGPLFDDAVATFSFKFFGNYVAASRTFTSGVPIRNAGLYGFELGGGDGDTLDYRSAVFGVVVAVDFAAAGVDFIGVDGDDDGTATDNRFDRATGVERYFGGIGGSVMGNVIDLSRATEATTVTFGWESSLSGNEFKDPNGWTDDASPPATVVDATTSIRVGTTSAANPTAALLMNASALNGLGASSWNRIEGTDFADTVVFSAFQDRNTAETLNLRGGRNVVDYGAGVAGGAADSYTLAVTDHTWSRGQNKTHAVTVTHRSADDFVDDVDTISISRQYNGAGIATDGTLTVIGSAGSQDTVTIAALGAPAASTGVTGSKAAGSAVVNEAALWTDLLGRVGGGHNRVDLGNGAPGAVGSVVQDVSLSLRGAQTDGAAPADAPTVFDDVATAIKAFEHVVGSAFNDRLFGSEGDNRIDGGAGDDLIQGRGGADTITAGPGNDRIVYTAPADTAHLNSPARPQLTASGFDTLLDFDDAGADLLAIDRAAGWDGLLGTRAVAAPVGTPFDAAGGTGVILFTDDDLLAASQFTDMAAVKAALGASANVAGPVVAGSRAIFAMEAKDSRVGVYVWEAAAAGDTTIDAAELRLLEVLDDTDIATAAAEGPEVFTPADLVIRWNAAAGRQSSQTLQAGVREEVVYSRLDQSPYGAVDSFANGAFRGGEDRIDLSGLRLDASGLLAVNRAIVVNQGGPANQITDAAATDFFIGPDGVRRAVRIEVDDDDTDPGTAALQGRARLFVDVDGDGQLDTLRDLFVDFGFTTAAALTAAEIAALETGAASAVNQPGLPGYGDLMFGT